MIIIFLQMIGNCYRLNCVLQKDMDTLAPGTWECDLTWKQSLCRCSQVKMRLLGWALIQYVTGVLIEERNLDVDARREHLVKTEGNCDDMASCCHKPRSIWGPQNLQEAEGFSPRSSRGSTALQHFLLRLLPSRTGRIDSVVYPTCGTLSRQS